MNLYKELSGYASYPISHEMILSILKGYKEPNQKIHRWIEKGILIPLKKGLYVAGNVITETTPSRELIANHLLGPSYISFDYALSYYGLIPERVFEISSATTKQSRKFDSPAGAFTYTHLPLPYFSYGISQLALSPEHHILMATPEKALCDKIITTRGINLRSMRESSQFLFEDLRMDERAIHRLKENEIRGWIKHAPKKRSLHFLMKTIMER